MRKVSRFAAAAAAVACAFCFLAVPRADAQGEADPSVALSAALVAACRANEAQFTNYLTSDSAAAFRALPSEQRSALLKRFALSDLPGKPLSSTDQQNLAILRCQTPSISVEYRFGAARVHENLAFIPVTVVNSGEETEFGLVRESGGWHLISLGLVLLDIPQLSRQWADQDLIASEEGAVATLRSLSDSIQTYYRAFGRMPESLAELGPAPKDQISPEQAALVNANLAAGKQGGYQFRYRIVPDPNGNDTKCELAATPESYGKSGRRSFFLDSGGNVHAADKHGTVATPDDPLLANEKTP